MKFILFIYSDPHLYPPTVNAANILVEKGHEVFLVGYKLIVPGRITINSKVNLIYIAKITHGWKGLLQYLHSYWFLFKIVLFQKVDWIISYDAFAAGPVMVVSKLLNKKWVYYQHDFWSNPKGIYHKLLHRLELISSRRASIVCFPQEDRLRIFQNLTRSLFNYTVIVHNGPRLSWIHRNNRHELIVNLNKKYENIIVYQGGWAHEFNLDVYIRALSLCKIQNVCLLFIGKEHEKGIKDYLLNIGKSLAIRDQLYFHDTYIPYDEILDITKFCKIGLSIPMISEEKNTTNIYYLAGASNKLGEYIACGLPILVSDTSSNHKFFDKYGTAFFFSPDDPIEIANLFDSLLINEGVLIQKSKHNTNVFKTTLNFDIQFSKLLEMIYSHES